jgi:flagellar protein FliJ
VKGFRFKLQSLLNIRRNRRDQCRQVLAEVLAHDDQLVARKTQYEQQRINQLGELRRLTSSGDLNVDASASRRYFAGQLTGWMLQVDQQRAIIAEQLELCRRALVQADQEVKALENLEEKQRAEYVYLQEQREQRELEDSWSATHREEAFPC